MQKNEEMQKSNQDQQNHNNKEIINFLKNGKADGLILSPMIVEGSPSMALKTKHQNLRKADELI